MKNVLIVFAHPKRESLNGQLLDRYVKGLRRKKHKIRVLDLYRAKFDPIYRLEKPDNKVIKYQNLIKWADHITFIFPTWWAGPPTILNGWFDRVFTARFAYKYSKFGPPIGLLKSKTASAITTYGGPAILTKLAGDYGWKRLKKSLLKFCGFKVTGRLALWSTNQSFGKKKIPKYLEKAEKFGETQFKE